MFYGFSQADQGELILNVKQAGSLCKYHPEERSLRFELTFCSTHSPLIQPNHLSKSSQFEQVKSEAAMGLSLFLAKDLIHQMNGDVNITEEGTKKTLWFSLPHDSPSKAPPPAKTSSTKKYQDDVRVLIADDNATCRKVLRQQCQLLGIQVIEAEDGLEALAKVRSEAYLERAFDAIILDHHMPGLKGLQVAERINRDNKKDDEIEHQPAIIILTGVTNPPGKYQTSKLDISSVLTKPVTRFTLQRALIKALEKKMKKNHTLEVEP